MIDGVDPQIIQDLGRELNSPQLALRFLTDFLAMLPPRFTRIQTAVAAQDREDAMDAVLSLKITAAMTGASEIEASCLALQASIKNEDFAVAQVQTRQLGDIVARLNQAARPFSTM
ncbi:Hpt domain-containing protein [Arthrobacter liuii]|uniref:HPt domain-containing protein n=1 Tax=Arthrobacter liuii TaxID=1476996 RepID=A0ABQ2AFY4_9MICC|nr:Hpt domain-containing protein [Arthrobacter liuii]GGH91122.1 hypothetical protein GCM10007170_06530 [Arthrobacter liuii]